MADYIPSNEAAKILWLWNLAEWLTRGEVRRAKSEG